MIPVVVSYLWGLAILEVCLYIHFYIFRNESCRCSGMSEATHLIREHDVQSYKPYVILSSLSSFGVICMVSVVSPDLGSTNLVINTNCDPDITLCANYAVYSV
jgi:hypothetical protein